MPMEISSLAMGMSFKNLPHLEQGSLRCLTLVALVKEKYPQARALARTLTIQHLPIPQQQPLPMKR